MEVTRRGVIMLWAGHNKTEGNPLKANHQLPLPPPPLTSIPGHPEHHTSEWKMGNRPSAALQNVDSETARGRAGERKIVFSGGLEVGAGGQVSDTELLFRHVDSLQHCRRSQGEMIHSIVFCELCYKATSARLRSRTWMQEMER